MGICAQRHVSITVRVGPDNTPVFGGPVGVGVLRCHQVHGKALHRWADGLGTECRHFQ